VDVSPMTSIDAYWTFTETRQWMQERWGSCRAFQLLWEWCERQAYFPEALYRCQVATWTRLIKPISAIRRYITTLSTSLEFPDKGQRRRWPLSCVTITPRPMQFDDHGACCKIWISPRNTPIAEPRFGAAWLTSSRADDFH
jgi:hypothetical protein